MAPSDSLVQRFLWKNRKMEYFRRYFNRLTTSYKYGTWLVFDLSHKTLTNNDEKKFRFFVSDYLKYCPLNQNLIIYLLILQILTCTDDVLNLCCTSSLVLKRCLIHTAHLSSYYIVSIGCYCTHADKFESVYLLLAENEEKWTKNHS